MSALFFIFEPVKTNWVYKFVRYITKAYFKNDKRVFTFVVCIAIATGFWFLNALSKTYTVEMSVPVKYVNLPDNKTISNHLPEKFDLRIKAHGFTILRSQVNFFFVPLEFNVNDMTSNRMMENKKSMYAFPTRQFLPDLSYQLSNELEITNMTPDTLYFIFGEMWQKRVKVRPLVQLNLKKQFQVSGEIKTIPDSVTVSGPKSVLDTLYSVITEKQKFDEVDQLIQTEASLQKIFRSKNIQKRIFLCQCYLKISPLN